MNKKQHNTIFSTHACLSEDTIHKYLNDILTYEEKHLVEQHLIDCGLCSDAVEGLAVCKKDVVLEKVKEINESINIGTPLEKTTPSKNNRKWLYAAAAVLLLLIGNVYFFINKDFKDNVVVENINTQDEEKTDKQIGKKEAVENNTMLNENKETMPVEKAEEKEMFQITIMNKQDSIKSITKKEIVIENLAEGEALVIPILSEKKNTDKVSDTVIVTDNKVDTEKTKVEKQNLAMNELSKSKMDNTTISNYKVVEKKSEQVNTNSSERNVQIQNLPEEKSNITMQKESVEVAEDNKQADTTIKKEKEDKTFLLVEDMPKFSKKKNGLEKFISSNLNYPAEAKEKGIAGVVYVRFKIEESGNISNVKVIKGIGGGCDEEAVRVVKQMPKWIPGKQGGNAVAVDYTLLIHFEIKK